MTKKIFFVFITVSLAISAVADIAAVPKVNHLCPGVSDQTVAINLAFHNDTLSTKNDLEFFKKMTGHYSKNTHNFTDKDVLSFDKKTFLQRLASAANGKKYVNLNIASHGINSDGDLKISVPLRTSATCQQQMQKECVESSDYRGFKVRGLEPYAGNDPSSASQSLPKSSKIDCNRCISNVFVSIDEIQNAIGKDKILFGVLDTCNAGAVSKTGKNRFFINSAQKDQRSFDGGRGGVLTQNLSSILYDAKKKNIRCGMDSDNDGFVSFQDLGTQLPRMERDQSAIAKVRGLEPVAAAGRSHEQISGTSTSFAAFAQADCFPVSGLNLDNVGQAGDACKYDNIKGTEKCVSGDNVRFNRYSSDKTELSAMCQLTKNSKVKVISESDELSPGTEKSFHLVRLENSKCPKVYGYISAEYLVNCSGGVKDESQTVGPGKVEK